MRRTTYHLFRLTKPQIVSANGRDHWAKKARRVAALRERGRIDGRGREPLTPPVRLTIAIGWPDARQRDAENLAPTVKALIDGLVTDAGLLPDDSDKHIVERIWRSSVTRAGCTEITLTFEEVEP